MTRASVLEAPNVDSRNILQYAAWYLINTLLYTFATLSLSLDGLDNSKLRDRRLPICAILVGLCHIHKLYKLVNNSYVWLECSYMYLIIFPKKKKNRQCKRAVGICITLRRQVRKNLNFLLFKILDTQVNRAICQLTNISKYYE